MNTQIVSLKVYRTLKECRRLFQAYRTRLSQMHKEELLAEVLRYRTEAANYPHHLLTVMKGEILMGTVKCQAVSDDLRAFAATEEIRLTGEIMSRLHEEFQQKG
jgi:hypothetical protein